MLELKNVVKNYSVGEMNVEALKGVTLCFRDCEFVSVLGPSGCGKTTLLNIIGGLDRYTTGDLIINGVSTKTYRSSDWDVYRNHSVGFVFQTYNLIPHQTVLANVELALTLSGVSKKERRRRAVEALQKVGLGDQLRKKPNQMSGGQMQRVAIARALVNNPDILLADEPTGALDSETSVAVMKILKEVASDRLVIMVTHNAELAEEYSTRIVKLLDGTVVSDSAPYVGTETETATNNAAVPSDGTSKNHETKKSHGKRSMSFFTALSLSFNNLMTKRTRTLLTSFAGSIGIIGIALILAMRTGIQAFIDNVQRETLASYPITLMQEENDIASMLTALMGAQTPSGEGEVHEDDAVYSSPMLYNMFNAIFTTEKKQNNLTSFKEFMDEQLKDPESPLSKYASAIHYSYDADINAYVMNPQGEYISCDVADVFDTVDTAGNQAMYNMLSTQLQAINMWEELTPSKDGSLISDATKAQYELVYGNWPEKYDELVLILDKNNEISDIAFYSLGLIDADEVTSIVNAALKGDKIETETRRLSYDEVCQRSFKLLVNSDYYTDSDNDGVWSYIGDDESMMKLIVNSAPEVHITGVVRATGDRSSMAVFGYTSALTENIIERTANSGVVKAQLAPENSNTDVLTGLPFTVDPDSVPDDQEKAEAVLRYFEGLTDKAKTELYLQLISTPPEGYVESAVEEYLKPYDTRDKLEMLIAESYSMELEDIKEYLSAYTDEQLIALIKEQVSELITKQYEAAAAERVEEIMRSPNEQELESMISVIISGLTTRELKIAYVAQAWGESTAMDDKAIMSYLSALNDDELDAAVRSVAEPEAIELYKQYGGDEASGYAKVAAAFDAQYGAFTDVSELSKLYDLCMPSGISDSTLKDNIAIFGSVDLNSPVAINLYADNFEAKEQLASVITDYNAQAVEDDKISYTDYLALVLSSVTDILDGVSIGLILFVSVSLVVSSIMIGIITYISVLERTKEIGILRAIGASRRDISRVFNAETIIVGLCSGLIGVGVSLAMCPLITYIVHTLSGLTDISAFLEPTAAVVLVVISMFLTVIAGLIPSGIAARKDPVVALRTE